VLRGAKIASMVKLPARIFAVLALAGLAYGVFSMSRINSSPAQDVAPPGCSEPGEPGTSEPGAAGGSAGSAGGGSGSSGAGDPDGTVSSVVNPNEGGYEWTLERMLLATPMPMTGEERAFLSKHPPLEQLLTWKQKDFDQYIADPLGLKHAAEEGVRWRDLSAMLKRQSEAGSRFFGPGKDVQPTVSNSSPSGDFEKLDFEQFQDRLKKDPQGGFAKLSQWRQEIKVLAARVEALRKKAASQGKTEEFERAIDDSGST